MVLISDGFVLARMMPSIRATIRSVSSTRVPTGARTWIRNWLSSDSGKNSLPTRGKMARAEASTTRMPPISVLRWSSAQLSWRW